MFYRPENGHGLPHNPFNAVVTPRPIGWISTRGRDGQDNLAPYSFFNAVAFTPPQVMFASTGQKDDREAGKDSLSNIIETGVFAVNVVEYAMKDAMNATSGGYGRDVDEFTHAGIKKGACHSIDCAFVMGAPAVLECRLTQIIELEGAHNKVVFGEVTGVHLRDDCMVDGAFDVTKFAPLARLGYQDYAVVRELFSLERP